ncbi:MFS transporter [Thauera sp.]|uniref:MFS transporter n=1 Tax=Thauera sp. TaxID=1905334 RepID=UPI002C8252A5|nr:MFS transporter [Thauera sp.]HRP24746.1 MFS transporter [Thauera sp.]
MRQLDVHKIADEAKFNGFHGVILAWCALIIIFDGYDLAVAGIAMPAIMQEMGVSATQAGFMASSALFGMMFGAIFLGTLADRIRIKRVLIGMYLLAAASISLLGQPMPTPLLFIVVGLAGASTIGTQIVTNAYAAQFYPLAIRSTGLGWALGIGRTGAILAPILIGVLVGMSLPLELNFVAIALPALFAALAIALVDNRVSAYEHREDVSAILPDNQEALRKA